MTINSLSVSQSVTGIRKPSVFLKVKVKKIFAYLQFPLLGLLALAIIYSGLGLVKYNNDILASQQSYADKIATLENKIQQNQQANDNKIAALENQLKTISSKADTTRVVTQTQFVETPVIQTVTATVTQIKNQATVTIENVGSYKVDLAGDNSAFEVLQLAAKQNSFSLEYQTYADLGEFVTSIAGIAPKANQYWAFYFNGKLSNVGASSQLVKNNDDIYWKLVTY